MIHKSGFVNIIGRPNVGKSTLMNALVGERMAIITSKAQTTRHRLIGILNGDGYQIVFSDTPGIIRQPHYRMHERMNSFVRGAFEDADIMLFVTEPGDIYEEDDPVIGQLKDLTVPLMLLINKSDLAKPEELTEIETRWNALVPFKETVVISALHKTNMETLLERVLFHLPEGPAYYPPDQLTDRPERFFVAEIIREKILQQYQQEIPYACEVGIDSYVETKTKDGVPLAKIGIYIFVERASQKPIVIGKGGEAIKKLGSDARRDIEAFLESKVFLEINVKVRDNWRNDERWLRAFGYND